MLDSLRGERLHDRVDERRGDAAAARVGHDVEIGQPAEPRARPACEREADGRSVVILGDEREPRVDDLADLLELARRVVVDVGRRRHLALERPPEILSAATSAGRRGADPSRPDARWSADSRCGAFPNPIRGLYACRARRRSSPSAVAGTIPLRSRRTSRSSGRAATSSIAWLQPSGTTQAGRAVGAGPAPARRSSGVRRRDDVRKRPRVGLLVAERPAGETEPERDERPLVASRVGVALVPAQPAPRARRARPRRRRPSPGPALRPEAERGERPDEAEQRAVEARVDGVDALRRGGSGTGAAARTPSPAAPRAVGDARRSRPAGTGRAPGPRGGRRSRPPSRDAAPA